MDEYAALASAKALENAKQKEEQLAAREEEHRQKAEVESDAALEACMAACDAAMIACKGVVEIDADRLVKYFQRSQGA
jgi:lipid A disaccharide synthetase